VGGRDTMSIGLEEATWNMDFGFSSAMSLNGPHLSYHVHQTLQRHHHHHAAGAH
jgi:hypothetical protein